MIRRAFRIGKGLAKLVAKEVRERRKTEKPYERHEAAPEKATLDEPVTPVKALDVQEVFAQLNATEPPTLLDCREIHEWEAGYIGGCTHIPMDELKDRVGELDKSKPMIVYCLHGIRSAEVAAWLEQVHGFSDVGSLDGGIVAWYAEYNQERIVVTRSEDH
jgi:rhodanese-related sulfurtransferase